MDADTVDQNYAQLEQQAQNTASLIQTLVGKLQAAATAGDQNAREWMLDLREIALGVQQEQGQVTLLLQSIHSMVDNHVQAVAAPVAPAPPAAPAAPVQQPAAAMGFGGMGMGRGMGGGMGMGGGGMLQRFLGGGFGQAMVAGAGFGLADDLIQNIL